MGKSRPKQFVFVLGAGASADLKLPMGAQLTGQISTALNYDQDSFNRVSGGDITLRQAFDRNRNTWARWYDAAKRIAAAMPLAPSIDNFVDAHRDDKVIAYCAKAAITRCILNAERNSTIYVDPSNIYNSITFHNSINSWHPLFFRNLTMYCTESQLAARLKNIAVISFNYDRCFEHYLFHAIKTYYDLPDLEVAEILSHLEIYHPYGKVGTLPHMGTQKPIRYGEEISPGDLLEISSQIRTFTESAIEDHVETERMREVLSGTEFLVFLGFAFHPLNVKLLFPNEPLLGTINDGKRVLGTAVGSSQSDLKIIKYDLAHRYNCEDSAVELRNDLKCDELFREYSRTLSLA